MGSRRWVEVLRTRVFPEDVGKAFISSRVDTFVAHSVKLRSERRTEIDSDRHRMVWLINAERPNMALQCLVPDALFARR